MVKSKTAKSIKTMDELVEKAGASLVPIKEGQMIDAEIIKVGKNKILVNAFDLNTGFIPEKEFSSDILDLKPGDKIPAFVISAENEEGKVVLSLKRASKERYLRNLDESFKGEKILKVRVKQANRGGLIVEYGNIEGFLPVSQLNSEHYPKVGDQKDKILERLRKLINSSLEVKVITLEPESQKVIFSEKEAGDKILEEKIKQFKIGQEVTGVITGIVDFGIFVNLGNIEGLVHISEISWDKVDNIKNLFKPGDRIKAQIIDTNNNRISLSIKRTQSDPWAEKIKNYKIGKSIKGQITKITPYGAFAKLEDGVNGMFHVSELSEMKDKENIKLNDLLEVGKEYKFVINNIEPQAHKIGLSWPKKKTKSK